MRRELQEARAARTAMDGHATKCVIVKKPLSPVTFDTASFVTSSPLRTATTTQAFAQSNSHPQDSKTSNKQQRESTSDSSETSDKDETSCSRVSSSDEEQEEQQNIINNINDLNNKEDGVRQLLLNEQVAVDQDDERQIAEAQDYDRRASLEKKRRRKNYVPKNVVTAKESMGKDPVPDVEIVGQNTTKIHRSRILIAPSGATYTTSYI